MKVFYDIHIHTGLSPCADEEMTPNNIINMAMIKDLDIIAITDHNSSDNCAACMSVAKGKNIIVIPGVELQTKEEVHLLCLFKNLESCTQFSKYINTKSADKINTPSFFGKQYIFNDKDEIVREESKMLISSIDISVKDAVIMVESYDGVVIPAHIDRSSFSIISNLGFIPKELGITSAEVSKCCDINTFLNKNPDYKYLNLLKNSDAHRLVDISERSNSIDIPKNTIECFLKALKRN